MWFYISKRGSTVLPYFLFCFLVLLSLYRIQAWMNRHSQKFLCQPFKTRCFQSSKIIITSSNTESVILDSYEFASAQQGLLTGILYHRNKLIPLLKTLSRIYFYLLVRILIYMRKKISLLRGIIRCFLSPITVYFSFRRRAISASLSPIWLIPTSVRLIWKITYSGSPLCFPFR